MAKRKKNNSPKRSQIKGKSHGRGASHKSKTSKVRKLMRLVLKGSSKKRKRG